MLTKILAAAATAALMMTASSGVAQAQRYSCGNSGQQAAGTVAGAILGGVLGNQLFKGERALGTAAGVVLGGMLGNRLSRDNCDQYYASTAYYDAFQNTDPYDRVNWRNPQSGSYGYIEPAEYYRDRRGRECRDYIQEIYVNGRRDYAEGVACRSRNGQWQIVR